MADDDWDLDKYYWPRGRVQRWWALGWDWESLLKKRCWHPDYETYADFYRPTFRFPDPRGKDDAAEISEDAYWGGRWLTEFPAGSGLKWDPYHLPLADPKTEKFSPKHPDYIGDGKWSDADRKALARGLQARMLAGKKRKRDEDFGQRNAPLSGIVVLPVTRLACRGHTVHVDFTDSLFGDLAFFTGATFGDLARFGGASFGDLADFDGATFGDLADFRGATFGDWANFDGATFGSWASFYAATFRGDARFAAGNRKTDGRRGGTLVAQDGFRPQAPAFTLTLERQHDARNELAFHDISFNQAEFRDDADFSGRTFAGKTDFFNATFHQVPNFHDATFGTNTKLSLGRHFFPPPGKWRWTRDGLENRLKARWDFFRNPTSRSLEFEQAYRHLKILMQGLGARTEEHFFYSLEIKSRIKRRDIATLEKLFAYLYWWVSDFGQGLWQPLAWLAGLNGATFWGLCKLSAASGSGGAQDGHQAIVYLLRNLVPGAWLRDLVVDKGDKLSDYQNWINRLLGAHPYAFYGLAIGHEVVTIALIFLFALAIKRKFQIK